MYMNLIGLLHTQLLIHTMPHLVFIIIYCVQSFECKAVVM